MPCFYLADADTTCFVKRSAAMNLLSAIVFYEWLVNLRREYKLVWKAEWTLPKVSDCYRYFITLCIYRCRVLDITIQAAYLLIRYTGVVHAIVDVSCSFLQSPQSTGRLISQS
jgi:hypothetical protein